MIVEQHISGINFRCIVGPHAGITDNRWLVVTDDIGVTQHQPAEFMRDPRSRIGPEREGAEAIDFVLRRFVLPALLRSRATPRAEIQAERAKRSPAHERAVRRAWSERRNARVHRVQIMGLIEAGQRENSRLACERDDANGPRPRAIRSPMRSRAWPAVWQ